METSAVSTLWTSGVPGPDRLRYLAWASTHISGSTDSNFTRFSFGIGGGVRFYPSRHVGFKIQAEWLPALVDPQVQTLFSTVTLKMTSLTEWDFPSHGHARS
jgi:hypothetical protein